MIVIKEDSSSPSEIHHLISEVEEFSLEMQSLIFGTDDVEEKKFFLLESSPNSTKFFPIISRMMDEVSSKQSSDNSDSTATPQRQFQDIEMLRRSARDFARHLTSIGFELDNFFETNNFDHEWNEQISSLDHYLKREVDLDDAFGIDPFYGLNQASKLRSLVYDGIFSDVKLPSAKIFLQLLVSEALAFLRGCFIACFNTKLPTQVTSRNTLSVEIRILRT